MALYFVGDRENISVDAWVEYDAALAGEGKLCVKPFVCPPPYHPRFKRTIREFFCGILTEAVGRGYSSLAMRLPGARGPLYSEGLVGAELGELILSYDIDLYIVLSERDRELILSGILPDFMPRGELGQIKCSSSFIHPRRRIPPLGYLESKRESVADECCSIEGAFDGSFDTPESLVDMLTRLDDGFAVTLLKLIDARGMDDVECYKASGVSRQTWYKIMNDKDYRPSKRTVLSFAIALRLDIEETRALLATVGFTLSRSLRFDVIVEYFIREGIYDVFVINGVLYSYDLECLGG